MASNNPWRNTGQCGITIALISDPKHNLRIVQYETENCFELPYPKFRNRIPWRYGTMLKRIEGYWMSIVAPGSFVIRLTLDPLPQGTNVYANISLSAVNTLFSRNDPDPKFATEAFVESWTFYKPDGTQSEPQVGMSFNQNAVAVENCATIKFALFGSRVAAIAQVNIFTL